MDPELLYAEVPPGYKGYVLSFHGSAKTTKNGRYGSCSWILWKLPFWDIEIAASAHLPSTTVNIAEYTGMNNGVIAALQRGVSDLIIVGDSRLAIQQSMGVIACRKDALQVELARHKELTKKLNSVRYLQVARHYNSAADSMATEALEAEAGRVVLSTERKAELRALNKIPEMLYACKNSTDTRENSADGDRNSTDTRENSVDGDRNSADDERNPAGASENSAKAAEEPSVTATTRSRARQVRFEDEREENGDTTERSEEVFENRSRPPTRRRTTRHETEFGGNQHIAELPVELGEVRTPDANDLDSLVIQAERRQRISKAQDEELRWADWKVYLMGELTQLSHGRAHNAGKVADELVLSKDGLLYQQDMAGRPEELDEASRVEDARHAGQYPSGLRPPNSAESTRPENRSKEIRLWWKQRRTQLRCGTGHVERLWQHVGRVNPGGVNKICHTRNCEWATMRAHDSRQRSARNTEEAPLNVYEAAGTSGRLKPSSRK
ncbi:unnamed protein product [Phytophthora fragariaefolia]|uniref:Unnamed protein product n=1 Tax=Phytophthora fragariaefolia TaxID=1490495 RepID=A0A9W6YM33_9STRA|nr:unnamed protein product [Phytophthora fragariaefolia]